MEDIWRLVPAYVGVLFTVISPVVFGLLRLGYKITVLEVSAEADRRVIATLTAASLGKAERLASIETRWARIEERLAQTERTLGEIWKLLLEKEHIK